MAQQNILGHELALSRAISARHPTANDCELGLVHCFKRFLSLHNTVMSQSFARWISRCKNMISLPRVGDLPKMRRSIPRFNKEQIL